MMMKNFGAVLIVSGGYFIGWVRVRQWRQRLILLEKIFALMTSYSADLKKYRRTLEECLGDEPIGEIILSGGTHKSLLKEDQALIKEFIGQLKKSSYRESMALADDFLNTLEKTIKKLREETASQGKALPLVTGAIGFLIAVLLY